jgi:type IV secretion system protein VirD4
METEQDKLLLGWRGGEGVPAGIGFAATSATEATEAEPVFADRESHMCTIASTGSGKNRSLILPALLTYRGSIVCLDPKGENAAVTARFRRSLGHEVHILDPFGVTGMEQARLDPLDCLRLPRAQLEADAEALCEMLFPEIREPRHAFWDNLARGLGSGLIVNAATTRLDKRKGLRGVYQILTAEDFEYDLAVSLDTGTVDHPYARTAFAQFLALGQGGHNNNVRPDTLATIRSHFGFLASEQVQASVGDSTIDLNDLVEDRPVTIYLVMPPEYMESHSRLLRAWLWTLIRTILMRQSPPELPTLFLLDEVGQLGTMPILRQAVTLLRSYGVRVWSFWQNLAQLRQCYPRDWETMIDNSRVLQAFGVTNYRMARELADLFGIGDPNVLMRLPKDKLIMVSGAPEAEFLRRADYLRDPLFKGRFDPNPMGDERNL